MQIRKGLSVKDKTPHPDDASANTVFAQRISLFDKTAEVETQRLSLLDWRGGNMEMFSDCPLSTARSCQSLFNKFSLPETAG